MTKKFDWKEYDNHLSNFREKSIKILEIGIDKGIKTNKFFDNKDNEYFRINNKESEHNDVVTDTGNVGIIETSKIHLIKNESTIAISELILQKISFDIILVNSLDIKKNFNTDCSIIFMLLNKEGILIFNDYVNVDINNTIKSLLNTFQNEIKILDIGYNIILKKVNVLENEIIKEFNSLLNTFWIDNDIRECGVLLNLKEMPNINIIHNESKNIMLRELKEIEIFNKLKLDHLMYKYIDANKIFNNINNDNDSLSKIAKYNKYTLFNSISAKKKKIFTNSNKGVEVNITNILIANQTIDLDKTKESFKNMNHIYDEYIENRFINIIDAVDDYTKIDILFENIKKEAISSHFMPGVHILRHNDFSKMYNNILLQILLCRYTLMITGYFLIIIDSRYDFINDLLLLLNHLFEKINIFRMVNKIGRLCIRIESHGFLGFNEKLFQTIYDIIKTDKEIISIFEKKHTYINIDIIQNNIFNQTKKIINYIMKHEDMILKNNKTIDLEITKRTVDDISTYLYKL
jgi:hypothetical protein